MKNISILSIAIFTMLCLGIFNPVKAQIDLGNNESVALMDTISNSQPKTFSIPVTPTTDSVTISLYCQGEIDLDTLDIKFGRSDTFRHNGLNSNWVYKLGATNVTYSQVLTVNLDAAVTSYTAVVVTIPASAFVGYNFIYGTITAASSGNVATDPKQTVVVLVTKY